MDIWLQTASDNEKELIEHLFSLCDEGDASYDEVSNILANNNLPQIILCEAMDWVLRENTESTNIGLLLLEYIDISISHQIYYNVARSGNVDVLRKLIFLNSDIPILDIYKGAQESNNEAMLSFVMKLGC